MSQYPAIPKLPYYTPSPLKTPTSSNDAQNANVGTILEFAFPKISKYMYEQVKH